MNIVQLIPVSGNYRLAFVDTTHGDALVADAVYEKPVAAWGLLEDEETGSTLVVPLVAQNDGTLNHSLDDSDMLGLLNPDEHVSKYNELAQSLLNEAQEFYEKALGG